jgi:hypothetical protein
MVRRASRPAAAVGAFAHTYGGATILENNYIGDVNAAVIAEALKTNTTVTKVDWSSVFAGRRVVVCSFGLTRCGSKRHK